MKTSTIAIIIASIAGIIAAGHLLNVFVIVLGYKFVVGVYNYFE